jgi:hypothetical protein
MRNSHLDTAKQIVWLLKGVQPRTVAGTAAASHLRGVLIITCTKRAIILIHRLVVSCFPLLETTNYSIMTTNVLPFGLKQVPHLGLLELSDC